MKRNQKLNRSFELLSSLKKIEEIKTSDSYNTNYNNDIEGAFDTHSKRFAINVKLHNCFLYEKDIVENSRHIKELIENNKEKEKDILSSIDDFIDSNYQLFNLYIETESENLLERLNYENVKYDFSYFAKIFTDYFNGLNEFSVDNAKRLLENATLKENLYNVDVENHWEGRSAGYFAPVPSDFFDSQLDEIYNFIEDMNTDIGELIDLLESFKTSFADSVISFREKSLNINNLTEDDKIELIDHLIKEGCTDEDFDYIESTLKTFSEDFNNANGCIYNYLQTKNSLKSIFKEVESMHEITNNKDSYCDFVINTSEFEDFFNDLKNKLKDENNLDENTSPVEVNFKI